MCVDPAIPADDHAVSDHRAWSNSASGANVRFGLNHTQRADFGGRINHRTLTHNRGGVNSGRPAARDGIVLRHEPNQHVVRL